ncbi:hypothetical protein Pure05_41790 [Paenarthrobacter ureafaciens]|nr:hypothetical protein Pure03_33030 [Paenarthrobacter ureafaciens]GLU73670.1 hypothetical protein Pure04_33850 [Paenarthrobacter ureafaciens]GLU78739.1 hypothetical protein Pure05_41790 [Paenarthrobacter ureafaciens]
MMAPFIRIMAGSDRSRAPATSFGKSVKGFSGRGGLVMVTPVVDAFPDYLGARTKLCGVSRSGWWRGTQGDGARGGADWRSAAGEWLLWFALGGGPPDVWEVPGPSSGKWQGLAGRWGFHPAR